MPIELVWDLTIGPQNGDWTFHVKRTPPDSNVLVMVSRSLPHQTVVQIYRDEVGAVPASELTLDDVLQNRVRLELRLIGMLESQIS